MTAISRHHAPAASAFALRSAAFTLVSIVLKTTDLARLAGELRERIGSTPELFDQDPVVIDLGPVRDDGTAIDFAELVGLLKQHGMLPVAAKGGRPEQMAAARAAGLAEAPEGGLAMPQRAEPAPQAEAAASLPVAAPRTMVIERPLRSGQQVYAKSADLVVLGAVNDGAEVIADGSIHVYAPLRGRAIAGAKGNEQARIYSTCMEPQLVSIAGIYRTTEIQLPADVLGKPAQIRLDGDRLLVEPLKA